MSFIRPFASMLLASAALLSPGTVSAAAAEGPPSLRIQFPVEKYKLENGLTVLLAEDHTVPMISYHTWYKVGSRDEKTGLTGAAHMLEHMMFQGAKKYTGKQFHKIMDENGVEWNAFTSNDYTGFYMNLPSSKLELIMDVEVDRMSSLAIDPKNLKSEREVVKEERRLRTDNSPVGTLREVMMSTIFRKSNYGWPVIGHMKDIDAYTADSLRGFYDKYYGPNNAVLVIAGDFEPSRVKSLIEKHYGALKPRPVPETPHPAEPPQTVQYNAIVRRDVQATQFTVAFQGAKMQEPDAFALDIASAIMGWGSSSRLYRRLVYQKEIASGASASHRAMIDAGVFGVSVAMKPGLDMAPALEIVYNEIYRIRNKPVTEAELRKAKTMVMKGFVDDLTTFDGKAQMLASMEIMTGDYAKLFTELEKYDAVTADDVRRVANKYLNQTQRSVVVLAPKENPSAAPPGDAVAPEAGAAPAPEVKR